MKMKHPALARLTINEMIAGNVPAPMHPAALKVYGELGLLK